jgi:hypothetical protein
MKLARAAVTRLLPTRIVDEDPILGSFMALSIGSDPNKAGQIV